MAGLSDVDLKFLAALLAFQSPVGPSETEGLSIPVEFAVSPQPLGVPQHIARVALGRWHGRRIAMMTTERCGATFGPHNQIENIAPPQWDETDGTDFPTQGGAHLMPFVYAEHTVLPGKDAVVFGGKTGLDPNDGPFDDFQAYVWTVTAPIDEWLDFVRRKLA